MARVWARICAAIRLGLLALCASLLATGPVRAAPDAVLDKLDAQLTELTALLNTDAAARGLPLPNLLRRTGLDGLTPDLPRVAAGPAVLGPSLGENPQNLAKSTLENFRLGLTMLTQVHGGQDNLDILLAHPEGQTQALTFRGGIVTLDHLRAALRERGLQPEMRPGQDILRVPVVLWQDTVLRLGPQEHLQLSRPDGAFVLSFGRVEIEGSRISTFGSENATSKDFVPFVTIGGGGSLRMRDASVRGLGFGNTPKFSGLSVVAHSLLPQTGRTEIINSHFEDIQTLSLSGINGATVSGNRFYNMRNNALMLSTVTASEVSGNLFFGKSPTNAIRVLRGSDDSVVKGNVLLEGDRSGILVQGHSNGVEVSGNVIWRRSGGAIKFSRTRCGVVRHNVVLNSLQKGIDLRSSDATVVQANMISGSRSAGIWISAQSGQATTYVTENILRGNKSGLSTATGADVLLHGNDFSDQFPRFVGGDIAPQNRAIVDDLRGGTPVLLSSFETRYPERFLLPDCQTGVRP